MSSTTDLRLKATFQDAIRRPDRAATAHAVEHGPTAGRRPDRSLFILPIDRIRPDQDQVRTRNKSVTDDEVRELAESIKAVGIENPLTVRYLRDQDLYQLVAGERRYTAAKLAGLAEVPVKLVDADENTVRRLQLHENIHRANLTPLELAEALNTLLADGETPDSLARLLCKSAGYVQKALTIARQLSQEAKELANGQPERFASMDVLYEVAQTSTEQQATLLTRIQQDNLTRDQVRAIAAPLKQIAKAERGSSRGRKAQPRRQSRMIRVDRGGIVTVSLQQENVTDADVCTALEQALKSIG